MPWSKHNSVFKEGWMQHYDGKSLAALAARSSKPKKVDTITTATPIEDVPTRITRAEGTSDVRTPLRYKGDESSLDKIKHILKHGMKYIYGK